MHQYQTAICWPACPVVYFACICAPADTCNLVVNLTLLLCKGGNSAASTSTHCVYSPVQVVQGYKFNIFYPDLIDKLEAPTYLLEKDPGADEHGSTCMLRWARLYIASFMHCFTFSINGRGQTGALGFV